MESKGYQKFVTHFRGEQGKQNCPVKRKQFNGIPPHVELLSD